MTIEVFDFCITVKWGSIYANPGGGLSYESDGDARRKIRINTVKGDQSGRGSGFI